MKYSTEKGVQSYYRVHQLALKCAAHWRQLVARRRRQASSVKTTATLAPDVSTRPSRSRPLKPHPSASYCPLLARLNAGEPQFCRPVPRKPTFLMESLTREGLYTAMDDHQPSHKSSAKSPRLDEAVELETLDRFNNVISSVLRNVENLPLDVSKHAMTMNSNGAVTVRNNTDAADQQTAFANQTLVDDVAVLTVSNVAKDKASSVHENNNVVPAMQHSIATFNPSSTNKLQLLPPTAFMSRADGTPIIDSEADHEQTLQFEKREKMWERDGVSLDTEAAGDSKSQDAAVNLDGECSGQLENDRDRMTDFLYIRKMLRSFADNKNKLKHAQATRQHLQSQLDELVSLSSADSVVASNDDDVKKVQQEIAAMDQNIAKLSAVVADSKPTARKLAERVQQLLTQS